MKSDKGDSSRGSDELFTILYYTTYYTKMMNVKVEDKRKIDKL